MKESASLSRQPVCSYTIHHSYQQQRIDLASPSGVVENQPVHCTLSPQPLPAYQSTELAIDEAANSSAAIPPEILTEAEIELITGLKSTSPTRQYNFLRLQKIYCFINRDQRLIVMWDWVRASGRQSDINEPSDACSKALNEPNFKAVRGYGAR